MSQFAAKALLEIGHLPAFQGPHHLVGEILRGEIYYPANTGRLADEVAHGLG